MADTSEQSPNDSEETGSPNSPPRRTSPRFVCKKKAVGKVAPKPSSEKSDDTNFTNPPGRRQKSPARKPAGKRAKTKVADSVPSGDECFEVLHGAHYCTTRCSPGSICEAIKEMKPELKTKIGNLGFEDILSFNVDAIEDRSIGMYLMFHVRDGPLRLVVRDKIIPVNGKAVNAVFGLPMGAKKLPTYTNKEKQTALIELRKLCDDHGMKKLFDEAAKGKDAGGKKKGGGKKKKYEDLGPTDVPRWVIEKFAKEKSDDDWTTMCFFMLLCNALLFPGYTPQMTGADYLMCKDLAAMKEYDWCSAVVDDIREKAGKWKTLSRKNNKTPTVQGCIVFLMVSD